MLRSVKDCFDLVLKALLFNMFSFPVPKTSRHRD